MKAIILAAGRSTRLYPLTLTRPKCLLEIGDTTLIEHQVNLLKEAGINEIVVVVGYLGYTIKEALGDRVRYKEYLNFSRTNNLFTLASVKEELNDDFICLFADVVLGKELLLKLIKNQEDFSLLVHNKEVLSDTMRVLIDKNGIYDIGSHIAVEKGNGNFIGVAKFSRKAAKYLIEEMDRLVEDEKYKNDYYTISLVSLALKGLKINPVLVEEHPWAEIDTLSDYERAKRDVFPNLR